MVTSTASDRDFISAIVGGFQEKLILKLLHLYFLLTRGMTMGVRCVVVNERLEVLLVARLRGWWNLPGGGVDVGESTEDAVLGKCSRRHRYSYADRRNSCVTQCKGTSRRDHVALFYDEFKEIPNRENSFELVSVSFRLSIICQTILKKWQIVAWASASIKNLWFYWSVMWRCRVWSLWIDTASMPLWLGGIFWYRREPAKLGF